MPDTETEIVLHLTLDEIDWGELASWFEDHAFPAVGRIVGRLDEAHLSRITTRHTRIVNWRSQVGRYTCRPETSAEGAERPGAGLVAAIKEMHFLATRIHR